MLSRQPPVRGTAAAIYRRVANGESRKQLSDANEV